MLSYLVTSNARKALLFLLWKDGVTGSVRELAKAAGVSYAAAHSELRAMQEHGLAMSRGDGAGVAFRANHSHPQADVLRLLLTSDDALSPKDPGPAADTVLANLKRYGAPLQGAVDLSEEWTLEETLAQALVLSHENATVLRVLPVFVTMNARSLDFDALRSRASVLRQRRSLGFVLELAATLSGDQSMMTHADSLRDRRVKQDTPYFSGGRGRFAQELARKNTPGVAKKWHFVLNMPLESFRGPFDKFAPSP